ncbi:MAG TPA: hypothetical protein VK525_08805 [Candidatus Saccharimonadales bacterium]|nr:hypothetical protein [Candidatus Saccharimonadales bacterium]
MLLRNFTPRSVPRALVILALSCMTLATSGCHDPSRHTTDATLRPIDDMLNIDLPKGTTKEKVVLYLTSRGFEPDALLDRNGLVATISHVDTQTLQPSAAEVTFLFDSGNNLISYELHSASNVRPMH